MSMRMCTECTFIILNKDQEASEIERMVGDVNLFMHDTEDRSNAEIEIMIAEEGARGKGIGKESLLLMIKFGIEKLKISRFFAKINTTNVSSIGLFRK